MSTIQISLSSDLSRLEKDGYEVVVVCGTSTHLLVKNVPYLNRNREVRRGTLECPLELDPTTGKTVNPVGNHQFWFLGEMPHHADGTTMEAEMVSDSNPTDRGDGIKADMAFSRKRGDLSSYPDYHEKVETYVSLLQNEAKAIDPSSDARTRKPLAVVEISDVFRYADMATTRSGSGAAATRLAAERIAIIGMGGTGSYILDLVAKTHVLEIRLFDGDVFHSHNAFRAPGAAGLEELGKAKVDYFAEMYGKMRKGIVPHREHLTARNSNLLDGVTFAFVAIDDATARSAIFSSLMQRQIPFIDVGMGVTALRDGRIRGTVRTTSVTQDKSDHVDARVSFGSGPGNDIYTSDIQVADLNALNATLAVLRWKKHRSYYQDERREHHSVYVIGTHALSKDERA